MVTGVYAPDSAKDFEEYEKFMWGLEGRKEGARCFFIAGGMDTELGFLCMWTRTRKRRGHADRSAGTELKRTREGLKKRCGRKL